MPTLGAMTLDEIDVTMAALRARRKVLKGSNKVVERKIITLARRRERLLQQVNALDEQISQIRGGRQAHPLPTPAQPRARRSQTEVSACLDAIVGCVKRYTVTKRAKIIKECHLSPSNATAYLRQLCQEGKLLRQGEKSATTYTLP